MPSPKKRSAIRGNPALLKLAERPQIEFELDFFAALIKRLPDYTDALRVHAGNLCEKGYLKEGLKLDHEIVALRPQDPTAHYDLARRYALLAQPDLALSTLRKAVDLGYSNLQHLTHDRDLDSLRQDPRFDDLLRVCHAR
jgi:tetratricopeptide (TPR) repeat protein